VQLPTADPRWEAEEALDQRALPLIERARRLRQLCKLARRQLDALPPDKRERAQEQAPRSADAVTWWLSWVALSSR